MKFMQATKSFQKELTIYSTIATGVLISFSSKGQIIYTDLIPDVELCGVWGCDDEYSFIDLNNDGIADFKINIDYDSTTNGSTQFYGSSSSTNSLKISAFNNNQVYADPVNQYILKMAAGQAIDSTKNWVQNGLLFYNHVESQQEIVNKGYWQPYTEGYVGLRIDVNGNTYYGWMRLHIHTYGWGSLVGPAIMDYAYNSIPDAPITASQTIQTSVENSSKEEIIKVSVVNHLLIVTIDASLLGSELLLYDPIGNVRQKLVAENTTTNIKLANASAGMCLLEVRKDGRQWVRKIVIN
jgi:hypothetical protein